MFLFILIRSRGNNATRFCQRHQGTQCPPQFPLFSSLVHHQRQPLISSGKTRFFSSSRKKTPLERQHEAYDQIWMERYEQVKDFMEKEGRAPQGVKTKLGRWVKEQRKLYNNGTLKRDRIDKLNAIDFPWRVKAKPVDFWKQQYDKLQLFLKENDGKWPKQRDDPALYQWIYRNRMLRKDGKLPKDQAKMFENISIDWNPNSNTRKTKEGERLEELKTFLNEHNGVWPKSGEHKIYLWVLEKKHAHAKGTLEEETKDALEALGIQWEIQEPSAAAKERWQRLKETPKTEG